MIELGLYEQIINQLFEIKLGDLNHQEFFIGKQAITKDNVAKYLSQYLYGLFEEVFSQFNQDEDSVEKAESIRKKIMATPIEADGNTIKVTMSFGCRQFDQNISIEDNISKADEHLYTAKESGRNCVIY